MHTGISENRPHFTVLLSIILALLASALPSPAYAADLFAGNIASIESDSPSHKLYIIRSGKAGLVTAKVGDALFKGDGLRTDSGVKAQAALPDGSTINMGPDSTLEMKHYEVNFSTGKRNYAIRALKGSMRFIIAKLFRSRSTGADTSWQDSNIAVETPTAIAGIKGTDFAVTIGEADVEIAVFEGLVGVKSAFSKVAGEIMLGANQVSRVVKGSRPGAPSMLSPQRRESLLRHTTPAAALQSLLKAINRVSKKTEKAKYGKEEIARDLAAGVPLKDILDNARESGMPVAEVISAAVQAGADPNVVVYTAIVEGYPAQTVVAAAIREGASLDAVVNAAMGAGANTNAIIAGATDAGAPPAAVANAIAASAAPASPSSGNGGNGAPGDAPTETYTPPAVGGGGGATPSTETASPSNPNP